MSSSLPEVPLSDEAKQTTPGPAHDDAGTPERVIIDTDPGIDDTMALFLALSSPQRLHIEGITIVFGNNSDLELLATNACRVLHMAGDIEIPIFKGCADPIDMDYHGHSGIEVHGQDGIGHLYLPTPPNTHLIRRDKTAVEFIIETCKANPGQITLITLGPLTNVAQALVQCPELPRYVKRIVTMGGVLNEPGNKSPVAEANFHNDAKAAKLVLNAGFELTMAPLNVTHQIHMNKEFRSALCALGVIGDFCENALKYYVGILSRWGNDPETIPMHDSSAVMAVVNPSVFTKAVNVYVDIEAVGERTAGMCVPDWKGHFKKEPQYHLKTKVLLGVDQAAFKRFYLDALATYLPKRQEEHSVSASASS
jgi:purine nucleosidase